MGTSEQGPRSGLTSTEQALLELMQIALEVDPSSTRVRELCRSWVRQPPTDGSHTVTLRAALRALLTALPEPTPSPLRGNSRSEGTWTTSRAGESQFPRDPETNQALLRAGRPGSSVGPVLDEESRRRVDRLISESSIRDRLIESGLQPSRSVLLSGPPGVGKTMTASHIAEQMKLPLVVVDLAAVMSSYLGRTGRNVRAILDYATSNECALFIDEFDALAKRRDDAADIGELKRLVNVLLLELDRWPPGSLLLAATNHLDLLDSAITRRFDVLLDLPLPNFKERSHLLSTIPAIEIGEIDDDVIGLLALSLGGFSHSDIIRSCNEIARASLVDDGDFRKLHRHIIEFSMKRLREEVKDDAAIRKSVALAAQKHLGLSQRKIASLLGVSHPTVSRMLTASDKN
ncbi:AAA family ATPase [Phaeacidiphilus oryzae]|uniref:AAA family ATPase n=1 Tax=Phaeacidiphilus oryzae TaxID=348818 RepID=UPI00126A5ED1|nr:AAA family ATPase [Phaeacidiphilus oryzae]